MFSPAAISGSSKRALEWFHLLLAAWLPACVFAAWLSQRPWARYPINASPTLSIIAGFSGLYGLPLLLLTSLMLYFAEERTRATAGFAVILIVYLISSGINEGLD
jgi:hypothetical protein